MRSGPHTFPSRGQGEVGQVACGVGGLWFRNFVTMTMRWWGHKVLVILISARGFLSLISFLEVLHFPQSLNAKGVGAA